jgi:3-oxoacyl-[acyl-carrier protein] reductase
MDLGLDGRVALVTGASKGIGRAIAAELAAEGARVVVSSRSTTQATADEIGAQAGLAWDSADVDGAAALVEQVTETIGPIDVLVCNTGGPPFGPDALGFSREQWQEAYETLVLAPMALIEAVLPGMRERGWGRVLNVVSTSVVEPIPFLMLSNAHRASMIAAFKTIARQVAADGVTLNSVLPGRIGTDRLADAAGSLDGAQEAARTQVPAGRIGTPQEMAAAAVFLCSDRASYITGARLAVDGGLLQSA